MVITSKFRRNLRFRLKMCGSKFAVKKNEILSRANVRGRTKAIVRLRSLFAAYKTHHNMQAMSVMLRSFMQRDRFRGLLHGYRLTRNFDAAEDSLLDEHASSCPELSPPGRRISSCRHMNESPDDRGALQRVDNRPGTAKSGAKKTRGGRSRRR
jgi:hypothetical protein